MPFLKVKDYIIKLIKSKNPFYSLIYNLFIKKLKELYNYLNNTSENKYIQYLILLIGAFIFLYQRRIIIYIFI